MPSLIDLAPEGLKVRWHRPWPRTVVEASAWKAAIGELAAGRWSLLGLWGEPATVHMAIADQAVAEIAVISLECPDRVYPSVGAQHPPAIRLERAIADLYGLSAQGGPDDRPWLDHDRWGVCFPLAGRIDMPEEASPILSSPRSATACIRSPSVRCMPASSNPVISAFPRAARRWSGWSSGSAIPTRASKG